MENWEDILAGYLEATESRADAEALRWKIHLAAEVREEVEAVLRLADEVAAAVGSVAVPEGAVVRLQQALHGQPDWAYRTAPAAWSHARAATAGEAGREDAVNAFIEGTPAAAVAAADPAGADEEVAGRLEQARSLTAHLSDLARRRPPAGAVDRLVSRLREEVAAGGADAGDARHAGHAGDESAEDSARRFLARLKMGSPRRPQLPARPDVLAASADAEQAKATDSTPAAPAEADNDPPAGNAGRQGPSDGPE